MPHVVRYNAAGVDEAYAELGLDATALADRLEAMLAVAGLPRRLSECGVPEDLLAELANEAAGQWTARFNPRVVGASELLAIYRMALA